MAESLFLPDSDDRAEIYSEILPQVEELVAGETDIVANLANIAAVLKEALGFFWVGFYIAKGGELVLGPFQGPLACTRIAFGKGVCGHAYELGETVIVPDVDAFPGHIACSSAARSEIVVPFFGPGGAVAGVIDVDSDQVDDFDENDRAGLEAIAAIVGNVINVPQKTL